jgi:hypothetical protein
MRHFLIAIFALLNLFIPPAWADIIDFNEFENVNQNIRANGYQKNGIRFLGTGDEGSDDALIVFDRNGPISADPFGGTLANGQGGFIRITAEMNQFFDLLSFDIDTTVEGVDLVLYLDVMFRENISTGALTRYEIELDTTRGNQRLNLNFFDIGFIQLSSNAPSESYVPIYYSNMQIDNFTFSIPEPHLTFSFLIACFSIFAFRRKLLAT